MNVPVPRRRQDASAASELERLRPAFLRDVDGWPDFPPVGDVFRDVFRDVDAALRDAVPLADVEERDDSYVIDVELPGVRKDDVNLEIAQGRLVVTGERRQRERVGLLRSRTRTTGRFRWEVTLPAAVDGDHVTATLDHGVLTVVVPKAERARRRRIPIGRGPSEGRA